MSNVENLSKECINNGMKLDIIKQLASSNEFPYSNNFIIKILEIVNKIIKK